VEVLVPYAEIPGRPTVPLAPRLESLAGRTLGFINNGWISLDITYDELRTLLTTRYEVREVIEKGKERSSPTPPEDFEDLLRRAQAVVIGLGN